MTFATNNQARSYEALRLLQLGGTLDASLTHVRALELAEEFLKLGKVVEIIPTY